MVEKTENIENLHQRIDSLQARILSLRDSL